MITALANFLRRLGRETISRLQHLGTFAIFLIIVLAKSAVSWRRFSLTIRQMYFTGVLSIIIIVVSGLFVGMVLALQAHSVLQRFGSTEILGAMVSISLLRELGPVMSALLFASRAGSSITTEIGLMKTTEQLAAMAIMAVDPMERVVGPRFWSGVLTMPLLAALFSLMGIWGAYLVGVVALGVDEGVFWSQMKSAMRFRADFVNSVIKSVFFGAVVSWIAVYEGMYSVPTAEGVSRATTRAVVNSALAILLLDFILTAFMFRD